MKINFASTRMAFFLIAILLVFIILSAIIPQKDIAQNQALDWHELLGDNYVIIENLALDKIYFSPAFFILLGLLAVNLAVGNIKRFRNIFKTERTLLKARHLGSILFHLSLLLILAGVILNYLYKFEGFFALTEGQSGQDNSAGYFHVLKGPFYKGTEDRFGLKLIRFDPYHAIENATTKAAEISIRWAHNRKADTVKLMTNFPYKKNNLEFHYGLISGFSPELILSDENNEKIFGGFVRLATRKIEGRGINRDFVIIPELNWKTELEIIESDIVNGTYVLNIKVADQDNILYDEMVRVGESFNIGEYDISIPRMRRWCYIIVVESPYLNLVFTGFWLALSGLAIGLIPRVMGAKRRTQL
jgi:hypothetical protein